jgi:hypothetical protein
MEFIFEVFEVFGDSAFCRAMGHDVAFQTCCTLSRTSGFEPTSFMVCGEMGRRGQSGSE